MSARRRSLSLVLAGIVVGSCGSPPPGPTATSGPTEGRRPATTPTWSFRSTPGSTDPAIGLPRIVIHSPSGGTAWSITEPGQPRRSTPLEVPPVDAELGLASSDGSVLATTAAWVGVAKIDGSVLWPTVSMPAPAGRAFVPACFSGDGRPLFADAETLTLVELTAAGLKPFADLPLTTGECAPLPDGRTLVAVDGGALFTVDTEGRSTPVVGTLGGHLTAGGGLVAMTDPSSEAGAAVVRRAPLADHDDFGPEIGRVMGREAERVTDAQLSPDGRWLAVILEGAMDARPEGRLRLYAVERDGLRLVDDLAIDVGSRITLMPGP